MEPTTIVLFGATGDLAKRKIYPALYNLYVEGKLPEPFSLIGLGRRDWSDGRFKDAVAQSLEEFSRRKAQDAGKLQSFLDAFRYSVLDIGREEDYQRLLSLVEKREEELRMPPNRLFYLSVGPEYFEPIAANIQKSGLGSANGWKRLVIEKPFGHDLRSARELNKKLSKSFTEEEIFRIDHYLGKPMVQRLESLQQGNPVIQALWDNRYIANVQITASETVGVEERAGYYDHVGAVRDMFQNHMLQLLMMTAIHVPHDSSAETVRFKKKGIMEALELVQKEDVHASVVRGQYAAGAIGGKPVPGYTSEPGVMPGSQNDTFIAAKLMIDNNLWRGVPFYIRTGKRMKEKSTRIVVEFKEPVKQALAANEDGTSPNLLVIEIGPNEGFKLQINAKEPGRDGRFKPIQIELQPNEADAPEAYENLIYDALRGDSTFFAHWDEVEMSWQWVQPVLDAFEENLVPLYPYEAGSYGPAAADELLARDGYRWWSGDNLDAQSSAGLDGKSAPPSESNTKSMENEGELYAYHANH
ncbi:glucose-6-phosphate dehydrogenase [Cohnella lubricantis]|uniref:Glucose-6-phosphate 1-dehydrogenase n=1 Tax=Cohnella lubricantis TaxID=2163172 RepID=A0A841TEE1_9BACL|nr:glucose-6-phosphate dehydrogenase [Cohnella lubricantis]MBB6677347.1 glucose-6-phosphate dehydrogenase [Cohnella lubricantis]MBP2119011.1 glucose-6-phosphate 1-dehydrogenase [Cohnella lubricantis]